VQSFSAGQHGILPVEFHAISKIQPKDDAKNDEKNDGIYRTYTINIMVYSCLMWIIGGINFPFPVMAVPPSDR
jgi:hypothetical protein